MKTLFRIVIIIALLYAGARWYERITEKNISDPLPTNAGDLLRSGTFIAKDGSHESRGTATEYVVGEEKLLRFEEFYSTNGLGLWVMLSENTTISPSTIKLGRLKGTSGDQNYTIPGEVDTSVFDTVIIYSKIFKTIFSTATLQ